MPKCISSLECSKGGFFLCNGHVFHHRRTTDTTHMLPAIWFKYTAQILTRIPTKIYITHPSTKKTLNTDMKKTLCIVNLVCMASLAATAQAQTYYQDSFNRTGELNGTAPTTNTGGNHWTVSTGTGSYATNGSAVYDKKAAYDSAYLPVNGSSGVTLDGTKDFTLSATITPDTTSGYYLGISLSTNPTPTNLWDSGLATMSLGNGYSGVWQGGTNLAYDYFTAGTFTITINYSHMAGTITFKYGSTVAYTLTGVTAAQVAAVRSVTIGNSAATPAALLGNFTLVVGP